MIKRNPFQFHYQFHFDNDLVKDYQFALDPDSLSMLPISSNHPVLPDWTRLSFHQCQCCPLEEGEHPNCPITINIMELVEAFKTVFSYHDCMVTCETVDRTYLKKTSVMEGLSSIFGVIMATSDCPIMEFLKPMARFHLPFATIEETTVRTASMYLMAQYFKHKDKPGMHFDFRTLEKHYGKVKYVNEGLLARINGIGIEDADKNAIVTLHSISQFLSMEIDYSLSGLEYIFANRFSD